MRFLAGVDRQRSDPDSSVRNGGECAILKRPRKGAWHALAYLSRMRFLAGVDRQRSDPDSSVRNGDECAILKRPRSIVEDRLQSDVRF
ncbi:MAG: hypothetical protein DRH30_13080 [Deltaproteobacteria bacterium]|nr:MAG: hypothetical protein DRH30_13080 [Deltaproteobacteria bacterium]